MEKQLDVLSCPQSACFKKEDLWDELLQSGCAEAGPVRPLNESEDLAELQIQRLTLLWAIDGADPCPELLRHPLNESSQLAETIAFLLGKKWNCPRTPLTPRLFLNGGTLLSFGPSQSRMGSLPQLGQLALLWLIADETEAGTRLIRWLIPFASLSSIWSAEEKYNEEEWCLTFSLLFRVIGNKNASLEFLKKVKKPIPAFFLALARHAPQIAIPDLCLSITDPVFGLTLKKSNKMTSAFTLTGSNSSLGVICANGVEIRAFGPQPLPFDGAKQFGVNSSPSEARSLEWTCCQGDPELWVQMKTEVREEGCSIDLKFAGLKQETPFAVAFYVKAGRCQIGGQNLKPKTLHRYSGEGKTLSLAGNEGELKIETSISHKIQVIPLAGEGCFWNADFLITFEMHPLMPSTRLSLSLGYTVRAN